MSEGGIDEDGRRSSWLVIVVYALAGLIAALAIAAVVVVVMGLRFGPEVAQPPEPDHAAQVGEAPAPTPEPPPRLEPVHQPEPDEALAGDDAADAPPSSPPFGDNAAQADEAGAETTDEVAASPVHASDGVVLNPVPDPGLVETTPIGPLPRIGDDGRKPWQVYARPFDENDARPRIAIIINTLGLSRNPTEAAIQGLPGAVTLAFLPYARDLQQWIQLARAAGHEVLVDLPMEPINYPISDPGPRALLVTFSPEDNIERLEWALAQFTGYVGAVNLMGSKFTTSTEAMGPILKTLRDRGLLYLDSRSSARSVGVVVATQLGVPRAINDRFLDAGEKSRANIDARLKEIERIAHEVGTSVAIGHGFPVTIERIRVWAETLDAKGLALAPVSAVVNRQADR